MAVALLCTMGGCSDGTYSLSKQKRLGVNGFGKSAQEILDFHQSLFKNPIAKSGLGFEEAKDHAFEHYVPTHMETLVRPLPKNKKLYVFNTELIPGNLREGILKNEIKSWQFYNYGTIYQTQINRAQTKDVEVLDPLTTKTMVRDRIDRQSFEIPHLTPGVAIWLEEVETGREDNQLFKEVAPDNSWHVCIDFGGVAFRLGRSSFDRSQFRDRPTLAKRLWPSDPNAYYLIYFEDPLFKDKETGLWEPSWGYRDISGRQTYSPGISGNRREVPEVPEGWNVHEELGGTVSFHPFLLTDHTWETLSGYEVKSSDKFKPTPQGIRVEDRALPPEKVRKKEEPAEIPKAEPQ